jgi:hypothetical protein
MAIVNTKWYLHNINYATVPAWATGQAKTVGNFVRATAPTVANERVYVCKVAGTTGASEPTWDTMQGANTAEAGGPTWQECTGKSAVNGDVVNTQPWEANYSITEAKAGVIIKNTLATHYFICNTNGTTGASEPTWDTDTGHTTVENTCTWYCLGPVGNFAAWGAPFSRLANVLATGWCAAGDTIYVSHSHGETQAAAMQLTFPGTAASPNYVLSVDDATAPPTQLASIASSSIITSGTYTITMRGFAYIYGIILMPGIGSTSTCYLYIGDTTYACGFIFDACHLYLTTTGSSARIRLGTAASATMRDAYVELVNTNVQFGNVSQTALLGGIIKIRNMTIVGIAPTTLFTTVNYVPVFMEVTGCDLSTLGSGKNLVSVAGLTYGRINFRNCKLGASVTTVTGSFAAPNNLEVNLENCDSADPSGACRMEKYNYQGSVVNSTSKYRKGGATNGVIAICKDIFPSVVFDACPLRSEPIYAWNEVLGQLIISVEVIRNITEYTVSMWLEVEYLGTSGFPQSVIITSKQPTFGTSTPLAIGAGGWQGVTAGWVSQKVSCTFTAAEKGLIRAFVCCATNSVQWYVDPRLVIT